MFHAGHHTKAASLNELFRLRSPIANVTKEDPQLLLGALPPASALARSAAPHRVMIARPP